jgi:serine acetyltransferase
VNTRDFILQDWKRNAGRTHIQVLLALFRAAQRARASRGPAAGLAPVLTVAYRCVALFAFSIDIPTSTRIGPGLAIHHGMGLVIHDRAHLGAQVTLRQNVTIGAKSGDAPAPRLGHGVDVGVGAVILGDITVGEGARVGACSVVLSPVPPGATVVGNPGRVIEPARQGAP